MWLPPIVQEFRPGEGNLRRVLHYFLHGGGQAHPLKDGYANVAVQFAAAPEWVTGHLRLNPFSGEPDPVGGTPLPLLLLPILLGAFIWWRRRSVVALRLLGLAALAAGLCVLAVARTIGPIYHYRLGWTRVVAMVALLTAVWALWEAVVDRWPNLERRLLMPLALTGLLGLTAVGVPRFARTGPLDKGGSDLVALLAPKLARLPSTNGPVILRCDGDASCVYGAGFLLWFDRHGINAQAEGPFGVITAGAPHRAYKGGPVRAVLHVSLAAQFYVDSAMPNNKVLAYSGAPPTAGRVRLANRILALTADFQRGRIKSGPYFFEHTELTQRLGSAIGVVSEPFNK